MCEIEPIMLKGVRLRCSVLLTADLTGLWSRGEKSIEAGAGL